jgi:hypothetical protein
MARCLAQRTHASRALLLSFLASSLSPSWRHRPRRPIPPASSRRYTPTGGRVRFWSQWPDRKRRGEWFSHALTALWATCDMRAYTINDELGALDFDVATNSQGLEVKSFTVKTLSRDASHATVVAKLTADNWVRKSDRENEILYDLVWERRRWAIDDVRSVIEPNPWSLRTILAQYLAR